MFLSLELVKMSFAIGRCALKKSAHIPVLSKNNFASLYPDLFTVLELPLCTPSGASFSTSPNFL